MHPMEGSALGGVERVGNVSGAGRSADTSYARRFQGLGLRSHQHSRDHELVSHRVQEGSEGRASVLRHPERLSE